MGWASPFLLGPCDLSLMINDVAPTSSCSKIEGVTIDAVAWLPQ